MCQAAAVRAASASSIACSELPLVSRSETTATAVTSQRVAIAIALAARPQLLIADEPTTALDVTVQDGVLALLERLVDERGMALLFISHDLAVVSRMVDRIVVLRDGLVVEAGSVAQVLQEPAEPYTRMLVDSARALDAFLDAGEVGR